MPLGLPCERPTDEDFLCFHGKDFATTKGKCFRSCDPRKDVFCGISKDSIKSQLDRHDWHGEYWCFMKNKDQGYSCDRDTDCSKIQPCGGCLRNKFTGICWRTCTDDDDSLCDRKTFLCFMKNNDNKLSCNQDADCTEDKKCEQWVRNA